MDKDNDKVHDVKIEKVEPEVSVPSPQVDIKPVVVLDSREVQNSGLMPADSGCSDKASKQKTDVPCVKQRIKPSIMSPLMQRRGQQKVSKTTQEQYPVMKTPSMYYASQFQMAAPTYLGHSVLGNQTGCGLGLRDSLFGDQTVVAVSSTSAGSLSESHRNSILPGLDRSRPSVIQPTPKVKVAPFVGSQLFQNPSSEVMSPSLKPAHTNSSKRSYPYMDVVPPPSPHALPSQHFSNHPPSTSKAPPSAAYTNNIFLRPSTKRSRFDPPSNHHPSGVQDEPIDLSVKTNSSSESATQAVNLSRPSSQKSPHIPHLNLSTSSTSSMPYSIDLTGKSSLDLSVPGKDSVTGRTSLVVPTSYYNGATSRSRSEVTKHKSQDSHSASFSSSQRAASAAPLQHTKVKKTPKIALFIHC